jgi:hypothetical protein
MYPPKAPNRLGLATVTRYKAYTHEPVITILRFPSPYRSEGPLVFSCCEKGSACIVVDHRPGRVCVVDEMSEPDGNAGSGNGDMRGGLGVGCADCGLGRSLFGRPGEGGTYIRLRLRSPLLWEGGSGIGPSLRLPLRHLNHSDQPIRATQPPHSRRHHDQLSSLNPPPIGPLVLVVPLNHNLLIQLNPRIYGTLWFSVLIPMRGDVS